MAKTESTAVNALIDAVQNRHALPAQDAAEDLFSAPPKVTSTKVQPPRMTASVPPMRGSGDVPPLPRGRAPASTAEHAMPPMPNVRMTTAAPSRGTTIPPLPKQRASSPLPPPRPSAPRPAPSGTLPPPSAPVAAPFEVKAPELRETKPSLPEIKPQQLVIEETYVGTSPVAKRKLDGKLIAGASVVAIGIGIGLGAFFAQSTRDNKSAKAPVAPIEAKAAAPVVEETVVRPAPRVAESENAGTTSAGGEQPQPPTKAEQAAEVAAASMTQDAPTEAVTATPAMREVKTATGGVITFADVRIDSAPSGATVTLVDRGKQSFLGTTPLSTSVDTSRAYDVIIALDGRPTQMVHLDPQSTTKLDVDLGGSVAVAKKATKVEKPVEKIETRGPARVEKRAAKPAEKVAAAAAPETSTGPGTLMVSSKPPCEIVIDGKPTGLTTPQRSIELTAGTHKVTFVNAGAGINKTVTVKIKAGQPTKLIQDLMR